MSDAHAHLAIPSARGSDRPASVAIAAAQGDGGVATG